MSDTTDHRDRPFTVGVFGGSFDPPHMGHSLLVALLRAQGQLDRLIVAPVFDHPLAKGTTTPFAKRLSWTRAAMQIHGDFAEVTDLERVLADAEPGQPSYSLRLLDAVAAQHRGATVRLVIGSDIVRRGETQRWHRWDEIESRYSPLVVPRTGYAESVDCVLPEVSSSDVREAVTRGDWDAVQRRVPHAVAELLRTPDRGDLWVIGRGHVARHAEPWLLQRGYRVRRVCGRAVTGGSVVWPSGTPKAVWILTSDDAIAPVARALAEADVLAQGVPVFHGAGARSAAALLGALQPRHPVGSLHPICALRRERIWPSLLGEATFGLEGDPEAEAFLERLVAPQSWLRLGGLDARARLAYHAACALAANHLSVLEARATAVLRGQGHAGPVAEAAIRTLMTSALSNLHALGIPDGITGPMSRGDVGAVQAHLAALDGPTRSLYARLSEELGDVLRAATPRESSS
ncbi:MAG: DUF2520 domain-containing protein [Nannocystaceae bacterium]|nr:DUF2520 domain-containing protein [Nannocystaceae bacterium]